MLTSIRHGIIAGLTALLLVGIGLKAADLGNAIYSETDASNSASTLFPEGMAPSAVNDNLRGFTGAIYRWYNHTQASTTSTGSSNAYVLTYAVTPAAYVTGDLYTFRANFLNTASPTLNVNGLGARSIVGPATSSMSLQVSQVRDGMHLSVGYDAATGTFRVQSPLAENKPVTPQGRLTLTTGVAVQVSATVSSATVYFTPYGGNTYPVYDGQSWINRVLTAELSQALDSSGNSGAHTAAGNFDFFLIDDANTARLCTGPAWTSDTARGTGAATTQLSIRDGIQVNLVSMACRFGTAAGNTVTVAPFRATYVGTMRTTAAGLTEYSFGGISAGGTDAKLFLWNMYNRAFVSATMRDNTDSWTYTGGWRSANASDFMRARFVRGFDEDTISAWYHCLGNSGAGNANCSVALDTSANITTNGISGMLGATTSSGRGGFVRIPGLGYHFAQAIEDGSGATVGTFYGDSGGGILQSGMTFETRM